MRERWSRLTGTLGRRLGLAESWLLDDPRALHGAAAARILVALSVLGLLVSNFSSRNVWVGQASVWAEPSRSVNRFPELALTTNVSSDVLTVVYVVTMLAAAALCVGWHAKAANLVTVVGFIAIVGQNPVVSDQSDNLVRLALIWLLLMCTADRWSLDARRRRRRAEGSRKAARAWDDENALPRWLSAGLHHVGLLGLGAQAVVLYTSSGLVKISEPVWQHGNALYYTMQLPEYRPLPWLSDVLTSSAAVVAVLTYAVMLSQLFFATLLLNPVSRRIVLATVVSVHVLLAVVLGLPWTSLALVAVTAVFVSEATYEWIDQRVRAATGLVADWFAIRGYDLLDLVDAARYRFVLPVVDWVRYTVLRRS